MEDTAYFAGGHVYGLVMRLRPDILFAAGEARPATPVRLEAYDDPSLLYIPPPHNAWGQPGDEVRRGIARHRYAPAAKAWRPGMRGGPAAGGQEGDGRARIRL